MLKRNRRMEETHKHRRNHEWGTKNYTQKISNLTKDLKYRCPDLFEEFKLSMFHFTVATSKLFAVSVEIVKYMLTF